MEDFKRLRDLMVDTQLISRGIKDIRVLDAMRKVPRHLFIDEYLWDRAYDDNALPLIEGQTISQPYMVALMTELLELKGDERVLEIGTGSGYQAAILSELAKEVYTVERIELLSIKAQKVLEILGYKNIFFKIANGTYGWEENAPFEGIMVTAGTPEIPKPLEEQLKIGGRLVIPVGDRYSQMLFKVVRTNWGFEKTAVTGCIFVPLVGDFGWKREDT